MLRRAAMAASRSRWLRRVAEQQRVPRAVAMRFVAGETLDDALSVSRRLNELGMGVSLDALGEAVADASVARRHRDAVRRTLVAMADAGIDGQLSVKPTALGLEVSPDLCRELTASLCVTAAEQGSDVTVDMEGSAHTQATVDLVLALHAEGHTNVGCAVQAYLYRTPDDVAKLVAAGASLRLCKGAYAEPAGIAYQDRRAVDAAFTRLADTLLRSGTYPRIATHDHRLIHHTKNLVRRYGLTVDDLEFQMLYGVRERLQWALVAEGWRVRIYVPFGRDWYPYFMRRIGERPANVAFFLRALAGRRG